MHEKQFSFVEFVPTKIWRLLVLNLKYKEFSILHVFAQTFDAFNYTWRVLNVYKHL
jgi:hypothetical protein